MSNNFTIIALYNQEKEAGQNGLSQEPQAIGFRTVIFIFIRLKSVIKIYFKRCIYGTIAHNEYFFKSI